MYIGKSPQTGAYSVLDSLTASATASYTMQLNSVNYSPESAQHLIVSLNGSIQKPNSSFTCSGSTLTFSEALTSSDSIDFIYALGNVLDVGTVSDSTITNAKTNFVSTSSAAGLTIKGDGTSDAYIGLSCSQNSHAIKLKSPPHSANANYTLVFPNDDGSSGQALTTNGSGVLTWADAGGTNTPNFRASLGSSPTLGTGADTLLPFANEIFDTDSAYDTSNGRFTVPSGKAGKYFLHAQIKTATSTNFNMLEIVLYQNTTAQTQARVYHDDYGSVNASALVDASVGDYFWVRAMQNSGGDLTLSTSVHHTFFTGFKLL